MFIVKNLIKRKPELRFNHITDIHVGIYNYAADIELFKSKFLSNQTDIIFATGDLINDYNTTLPDWTNLKNAIEAKAKTLFVRGNHDFNMTNAQLGLPSDYYTFDKGSWRFIVLCCVGVPNGSYIGTYAIDPVQLAWLQTTLANSSGKNVAILTHVPFHSPGNNIWKGYKPGGSTTNLVYTDASFKEVTTIFRQYKNIIKGVFCGHDHIQGMTETEGIKHFVGSAVSGYWWQNPLVWEYHQRGFANGLLYENGDIRYEVVNY
jgi:3',5'-cyclic AMP phosphodiesterase CpdA